MRTSSHIICCLGQIVLLVYLTVSCRQGYFSDIDTENSGQDIDTTLRYATPYIPSVNNPSEDIAPDLLINETEGYSAANDEDIVDSFSAKGTVTVTYSGTTVTVSDPSGLISSQSIEGAKVTLYSSKKTEYILSGESSEGLFRLFTDSKSSIVLNGLNLRNNSGPAIDIQEYTDGGKRIYLILPNDTDNYLEDAAGYDHSATFFNEGKILISGGGRLTVKGNNKHAVASDDYVRLFSGIITVSGAASDGFHVNDGVIVEDGTLDITASGDGIQADKGSIGINGGTVTVKAVDDGFKTDNEDSEEDVRPFIKVNNGIINLVSTGDTGKGFSSTSNVIINGGTVSMELSGKAAKGIKSDCNTVISGGIITITTNGDAWYDTDESDISSPACINCDGNCLITGSGTRLIFKSTGKAGKGISCNGDLIIEDGSLDVTTTGKQYVYSQTLDSSAKGIKSDGILLITGGNIQVVTSGGEGSEGIESKTILCITGGTLDVNSYDDCMNAANALYIHGGKIYCYSTNNDGIDSNGTLTVTGGLIVVLGTTAPEEGFDCDNNTFSITGGTILGIGGTTSKPTAWACGQYSLIYSGTGTSNQLFSITSPDNSLIMGFKLPRSYQGGMTLLFSSSALFSGETYTLYSGGSISGLAWNGFYESGTYSKGTSLGLFKTTAAISTIGSATGGFPNK